VGGGGSPRGISQRGIKLDSGGGFMYVQHTVLLILSHCL
jgi:hypothetical protein